MLERHCYSLMGLPVEKECKHWNRHSRLVGCFMGKTLSTPISTTLGRLASLGGWVWRHYQWNGLSLNQYYVLGGLLNNITIMSLNSDSTVTPNDSVAGFCYHYVVLLISHMIYNWYTITNFYLACGSSCDAHGSSQDAHSSRCQFDLSGSCHCFYWSVDHRVVSDCHCLMGPSFLKYVVQMCHHHSLLKVYNLQLIGDLVNLLIYAVHVIINHLPNDCEMYQTKYSWLLAWW